MLSLKQSEKINKNIKNKIFIAGVLMMTLAITGNAYAANQNNNSGTDNQVQQQTQNENTVGTNTGTQTQQQTRQKLQDGSGTGNQIQNQNQIKNQGESDQIQNKKQEGTQSQNKSGSAVAQQRRSQVANAVQEILQVAERNAGIGQQVRTIVQTKTQNQEDLETSLQKVQSRKELTKFFVGPNYSEINKTRKLLEQNREQIKQLNQIKDQLINQDDQQILIEQIQTLEQANLEIENSLETAQKGFHLFGWMFRLFAI